MTLTIIRRDLDATLSVYDDNRHLGLVYCPIPGRSTKYEAMDDTGARAAKAFATEAEAIAYLATGPRPHIGDKPMTPYLYINILHGASEVDEDDKDRAEAAALVYFAERGIDPAAAWAEFKRQWAWLETDEANAAGKCQDYDDLTGLAAEWAAAERKADIALTEGWPDTGSASCGIGL